MDSPRDVSRTKKSVLQVMRGYMPEAKKQAWRSIENYLKIDHLHQVLINTSEDKPDLGEGSCDADVVFIFDRKPTSEEESLYRSILNATGLPESLTYRFVQDLDMTHTKARKMGRIQLVEIINPYIIVHFGAPAQVMMTERHPLYLGTFSLQELLPIDPDHQEKKKKLWKDLKQILTCYDEIMDKEE